jgi:hypothetical protein
MVPYLTACRRSDQSQSDHALAEQTSEKSDHARRSDCRVDDRRARPHAWCQTPIVQTDTDQLLVALAFFTAWRSEFDPTVPRDCPLPVWTGLLDNMRDEPDARQTLIELSTGTMQLCNLMLDLIAQDAESSRDEILTRITRHVQETKG